MALYRYRPSVDNFNPDAKLPYELRLNDFEMAMQDVYDFFYSVKAGEQGVEIKATRKHGGVVDTHGAREQWLCVFVLAVDNTTEPAVDRHPMKFREVYLSQVTIEDFRKNPRGELGQRFFGYTNVAFIFLDPDTAITYGFSRSECGSGARKWIQDYAFAKRQYTADDPPKKRLGL